MTAHHRRFVIPYQPLIAWYVGGRKLFGREPVAIRRSWKVGRYAKSLSAMRSVKVPGKRFRMGREIGLPQRPRYQSEDDGPGLAASASRRSSSRSTASRMNDD